MESTCNRSPWENFRIRGEELSGVLRLLQQIVNDNTKKPVKTIEIDRDYILMKFPRVEDSEGGRISFTIIADSSFPSSKDPSQIEEFEIHYDFPKKTEGTLLQSIWLRRDSKKPNFWEVKEASTFKLFATEDPRQFPPERVIPRLEYLLSAYKKNAPRRNSS